MKTEYKHIVFNYTLQNLQDICDKQKGMLVSIIPYTMYEAVAIFKVEEKK
jgi:hypothetical protein